MRERPRLERTQHASMEPFSCVSMGLIFLVRLRTQPLLAAVSSVRGKLRLQDQEYIDRRHAARKARPLISSSDIAPVWSLRQPACCIQENHKFKDMAGLREVCLGSCIVVRYYSTVLPLNFEEQ